MADTFTQNGVGNPEPDGSDKDNKPNEGIQPVCDNKPAYLKHSYEPATQVDSQGNVRPKGWNTKFEGPAWRGGSPYVSYGGADEPTAHNTQSCETMYILLMVVVVDRELRKPEVDQTVVVVPYHIDHKRVVVGLNILHRHIQRVGHTGRPNPERFRRVAFGF